MQFYQTYTDHDLLELLKGRDEAAFTEIYERYWERLFGMAYNRLKEVERAEDALHEVSPIFGKTENILKFHHSQIISLLHLNR